MGLVVRLANSFRPRDSSELDEYIQLGRIGLLKAIRQHNSARGQLSTLAWHYIRWEIIRFINDNNNESFIRNHETDSQPNMLWEIFPDTLDETELKIINLRNQGYTFQEISTKLGNCTRGWAHKLFQQAIDKIRYAN